MNAERRAKLREAVLSRFGIADEIPCHYCRNMVKRAEVTLDHVYPRALGGRDEARNLVPACRPCNQEKGARLGAEFDPRGGCGSVLGVLPCSLGRTAHTIHQAVVPSTGATKRWVDRYSAQRICK